MAPKRKAEDRNAQQRKAPYRNAHRSSSSHPPPNVSMPVLPTEIRLVIIPYYLDNLITNPILLKYDAENELDKLYLAFPDLRSTITNLLEMMKSKKKCEHVDLRQVYRLKPRDASYAADFVRKAVRLEQQERLLDHLHKYSL